MCVLKHRYPLTSLNDPLDFTRLTEAQERAIEKFIEDRKRDLDAIPPRGLRPIGTVSGWQCPNCGNAHAPDVMTCPDPPRGGSLRKRLTGTV